MLRKKDGSIIGLEDLKGIMRSGYLIYTNAVESGENKGGYIEINEKNWMGIDQVLLDIGFEFLETGTNRMEKEACRINYNPVTDFDFGLNSAILDTDMKTRINFLYGLTETTVYETVEALLKNGYSVIAITLKNGCIIDKYIHFVPDKEEYSATELETKN